MADSTLAALTANTDPQGTDILYLVDDPGGTPADNKITVANLLASLPGNLDVNGNSIVSTSNGNITLAPNGTGNVVLGNYVLDADATVGAAQDNYVMTYNHSAGTWGPEASAGGGGSPGGSSGDLQYNNGGSFGGSVLKQGTNTIEQYNSTNAQTLNIYNTRTDASNYERLRMGWDTNVFKFEVQGSGTGTSERDVEFISEAYTFLKYNSTSGNVEVGGSSVTINGGQGFFVSNSRWFDNNGSSAGGLKWGSGLRLTQSSSGVLLMSNGTAATGAAYGATDRNADPANPAAGSHAIWQSDGTGSGDDGDIMIKITDSGGTTKTITLVDYSAF